MESSKSLHFGPYVYKICSVIERGICLVVEIVQFIVGSVLFFILFFVITFIINMLVSQTWVITLLYPFIIIIFVCKYSFLDYLTLPETAFTAVLEIFTSMTLVEAIYIIFGFIGTIVAGIVMRALRKAGYQMF